MGQKSKEQALQKEVLAQINAAVNRHAARYSEFHIDRPVQPKRPTRLIFKGSDGIIEVENDGELEREFPDTTAQS